MPRAGLSTAVVTEAAGDLADEIGLPNLTLAALAARLGVRLPSLYKHVDGLAALHRAMALSAKRSLAEVMRRATVGRSGREALIALTEALRSWARDHPGRWDASTKAPGDDPEDRAVSAEAIDVIFQALSGYGVDEPTAIDATRTLRAGVDGFIRLERESGFGLDRPVEASVAFFLTGLDRALTRSDPPSRPGAGGDE